VYLGTKPSGRGRGYARKLIEQMAAKADAEGRAMYLESSSQSNNAYYAKFGFEAMKDIFLGADAAGDSTKQPVRLTIMVREPRKVLSHSIPIKLCGGFKIM
jgi:N-acetylglutamate synthase-like GNAT family acetyltransferase